MPPHSPDMPGVGEDQHASRRHTGAARAGTQALRVGFVVHVLGVAGAEALVAATIRGLGPRIEPTVLCLDGIGQIGEELLAEGIVVEALDRKPGLDWALVGRIGAAIRRHRLEVVHAHQYTPFFYAALAKLRGRLPFRLVLTEHGRHYPDVVSRKRRTVNRWLLSRQVDAINACSRFSADALSQQDGFPPERIEVIENGISLGSYGRATDPEEARKELGLDPSTRYIALIGRFHPVKDHETMLRAFRDVRDQRSDVELLLVGDGERRQRLEALTEELGLSGAVRFEGIRRDVPKILSAIDVFCLTSLTEAASLTLLEAMASSLPVVVTDVGGNPEIVRDGREGLLAPRRDHGAVAKAILALLGDPARAKAMGEAGRARVEANYDLERTVSRYGELYERLGGRGGRSDRSGHGRGRAAAVEGTE